MSEQAEIDQLRNEAPIETADDATPAAPAAQAAPTIDAFKPLCVELVRGFGFAVTQRAKAAPLANDEIDRIASALAGVAACYDLARLDARTAAWLTLGIAVSSVAIPRLQAPKIEAPAPQPAPADDASSA